ncbi:MAG: hypothetical protein GY820_20615, partial [Gammaproteobacteria bacterium]|nr:hypothetical protein [Gammaproteobacteria bacterium]
MISEAAAVVSHPYGLPKIHKIEMPLRLIVPMIGTVGYVLSRYLDKLLRPIVNKIEFRIRGGEDLLEKLSQLKLNTNQIFLGSLDVVALFPNVEISFLLQKLPKILSDHESLWKNTENPLCHLSAEGVTSLIQALCNSTFFKFDATVYKQLNGVPMGSPVSVALSELFMWCVESSALSSCPVNPLFYGRYIDDILVVAQDQASFRTIHSHFNSCNANLPGLKFTSEEESDGILSFLDVLIRRTSNEFEFSVHRKGTHSNRYCHPHSAVPSSILCGLIRTMRFRAQKYCSTDTAFSGEISHLNYALQNNCYSLSLLRRHLLQPKFGPRISKKSDFSDMVVLPFLGNLSYKIRNLLFCHNINVRFKCSNTLGACFYRKFERNTKTQNVVYRIACNACESVYVGQTKRLLKIRAFEHVNAIAKKSCVESAIAEHCIINGHSISVDRFRVVDRELNLFKRLVKESFHIAANPSACNSKQNSVPISSAWLSLCKFLNV